jgi:hypothetical protein
MMNLADYYEQLPDLTAPKTEFVSRLAQRCGLKEATVRLWLKGRTQPKRNSVDYDRILDILAEETGIEKENLFAK